MSQKRQATTGNQEHTPQRGQEFGRVHQVQEREHHNREQLGQEKHKAGEIKPGERRTEPRGNEAPEGLGITIYINRIPYHAASTTVTGADVRKMAIPPIGPDQNIFRVVAGKGSDIKLSDSDVIRVDMHEGKQGRHFYSENIVPIEAVAKKAYAIFQEEGCKDGSDVDNWLKAEALLEKEIPHPL